MKLSDFNIEENLFKAVTVSWMDIVTYGGWISKDKMEAEHSPLDSCSTMGFLTYKGKKEDIEYLVISATHAVNGPDQYNQHIVIPSCCISNIELLD